MDDLTERPRAWLAVSDQPDGAGLVLALGGELDLASLPDVSAQLDALLDSERRPVRLDLADLTFMDSSGVTLLVRIANHAESVRTVHARQPVRRVLEVLGLAGRLGLEGA